VGVNITLIVQVDPTGTEVPQVLVCEYELALVPVSVMLVMGSAALPVLVTVTDCGALAVPVGTLPNASEVGEIVKGTNPVPVSVALCVAPDALTVSAAA
jgi:hypothetical protein